MPLNCSSKVSHIFWTVSYSVLIITILFLEMVLSRHSDEYYIAIILIVLGLNYHIIITNLLREGNIVIFWA